MKVTVYELDRSTLSDFADAHGLELEVHERGQDVPMDRRYYASFKHCSLREGQASLCYAIGDGPTKEEAIANYARRISGKRMHFDITLVEGNDFDVPILTV